MNQELIKSVAGRIKLVTVNCGAWRAKRGNKAESVAVNERHGTVNVASVSVRLTDHASLVGIYDGKGACVKQGLYSLHSEVYAFNQSKTFPSVMDGMRVVPLGFEFEHSNAMKEFKAKHDSLVSEFLSAYEAIKEEAPFKLNGLFDGKQWPSLEKVASKFSFTTRYLECPTDGAWADWLGDTVECVQLELRERLVTYARHMADVCGNDRRIFQSTLDNLREVCALAGSQFNLADDPIIAQAAKSLSQVMGTVDINVLRDSETTRKSVAQQVNSVLSTFGL